MDLDTVAAWMTRQGLGDGPLKNVEAVAGGTQNTMLRFERDGRSYVLRREPAHPKPISNTVTLRATSKLAALSRHGAAEHSTVVLSGCSNPGCFLNHQVPQWISEIFGYSSTENYSGHDILCSTTAFASRHARNTTRDRSGSNWCAAPARFKLGIILGRTRTRSAAGLAPRKIGDHLHAATVRLIERAHAIIEGEP